ncbi:unnamed protein product [Diabrotica balteata]|uniref:Cyclin-dependent kinase inhibitor domain-containing protein n=1 Tax=Diabrotica balteata TaxID=107213 RepID=A0A9P0DYY7_DIABA|nr:unnamed protein product [Diabrotica balteata]
MADRHTDPKTNDSNTPVKNSKQSQNSPQTNAVEHFENHGVQPGSERLQNVRRRLNFDEKNQDSDYDSDDASFRCDQKEAEEKRMKWNFDFKNEIPLNGDWVWERVAVEYPQATDIVSSMMEEDQNRNI